VKAPLGLVQDAVANRGFLGVKLYPPMGFLPLRNEGSGLPYPSAAPPDFGKRLDQALDQLYGWAEANEAPLLAHAGKGNGSGPGYAERADPSNWRPVLAAHRTLHLSLAHFGEFLGATDAPPWEEHVGALIVDFPNVYADLSYLHGLVGNGAGRDHVVSRLRAFLKRHPAIEDRLLYGSDWIMLGREARHEGYPVACEQLLRDADFSSSQIAKVRRHNAIAFLGLSGGHVVRRRLDTWRAARGLPALTQFD